MKCPDKKFSYGGGTETYGVNMKVEMWNIFSNLYVLYLFFVKSILEYLEDDLDSKVDNLNSTDDGEPSEESHGSSNSWQHIHKLGCSILGDFVKSGGIKVDPHKS